MKINLFGEAVASETIRLNIYADESLNRICPDTNAVWHYIGLVIEVVSNPLLPIILEKRFKGNFDQTSKYFAKNNRKVHWTDIRNADDANIVRRWFDFILNPLESERCFYAYIMGLDTSKLNLDEFDSGDLNTIYNRFFRSAVKYALRKYFPKQKIEIENIFHEVGSQQDSPYFPWHCLKKIAEQDNNITVLCDGITFLGKDHTKDDRGNIIQLCDCFLGATVNVLHGINTSSKSAIQRRALVEQITPLIERIIKNPSNKNSRYKYINRISVGFFPKENTPKDDLLRSTNQFYTSRELLYLLEKSGQQRLF